MSQISHLPHASNSHLLQPDTQRQQVGSEAAGHKSDKASMRTLCQLSYEEMQLALRHPLACVSVHVASSQENEIQIETFNHLSNSFVTSDISGHWSDPKNAIYIRVTTKDSQPLYAQSSCFISRSLTIHPCTPASLRLHRWQAVV